MCPDRHPAPRPFRPRPGRAGGFSIVSAIFLLVVLAALGAMIVTFSTVQHATAAQDVQSARAYQAARAGIEWGLYQVLRPATPGCAGSTTFSPSDLPAAERLDGELAPFTVTVTCAASDPIVENGVTTAIYAIESTASFGTQPGELGYVERRVRVIAER